MAGMAHGWTTYTRLEPALPSTATRVPPGRDGERSWNCSTGKQRPSWMSCVLEIISNLNVGAWFWSLNACVKLDSRLARPTVRSLYWLKKLDEAKFTEAMCLGSTVGFPSLQEVLSSFEPELLESSSWGGSSASTRLLLTIRVGGWQARWERSWTSWTKMLASPISAAPGVWPLLLLPFLVFWKHLMLTDHSYFWTLAFPWGADLTGPVMTIGGTGIDDCSACSRLSLSGYIHPAHGSVIVHAHQTSHLSFQHKVFTLTAGPQLRFSCELAGRWVAVLNRPADCAVFSRKRYAWTWWKALKLRYTSNQLRVAWAGRF